MSILAALFIVVSAQAGWWGKFCDRHLVSLDPSTYDLSATGWLLAEAERRQIKETWGTIARWEQEELNLMRAKLNLRLLYTNDLKEKAEITRAMQRGLKVGILP